MKVQFDSPILDLKGQPLKEGDDEVTLSTVACAAMLAVSQEDQNSDGPKKMKMFRLAQKASDGGEQDVPVEDITLLKERVGKLYSPLIVGRVYDLLEGADK